jgi:hypothetical protein
MKKWLLNILILIVVIIVGLEIYTRFPSSAALEPLGLPADTKYAVLLFHGSNGKDDPLMIASSERIKQIIGADSGVELRYIVWSPWSDNRLRANINGRELAKAYGAELASLSDLTHLRLIAHSAGAYLLDPICEAIRQSDGPQPHIEMTFLDGMGIQGGWDYGYGYRHYGECADFSLGIYSLDPVPGTNEPLQQSYSLDVTNDPTRSDIPSHLWPVEYFLNNLSVAAMTPGARSHESLPRGELATP